MLTGVCVWVHGQGKCGANAGKARSKATTVLPRTHTTHSVDGVWEGGVRTGRGFSQLS